MTKYLVYVHPSVPPPNIHIGSWYSLEELQERFSLEYIKCFFNSCNFSYSELENKKVYKEIIENEE